MSRLHHLLIPLFGIILLNHSGLCFSEEIIILGNHNKPPKYYLEKNKAQGILVDIMKYVDQEIPQSFKFKLYPWKRAYVNAINGEGGIIGLSMNSERLKIFDYSDVMFYDELVLVVLKGNEFPFNSIQDLKGKRVGVRRGSSYGEEFEKAKNKIFVPDEDKSGKQRLLKLLSNRIDVALVGPGKFGLYNIIGQHEHLIDRKDDFVILPKPFKRDPNYLGFSKAMNMQGFIERFNEVLNKGQQSGVIQKIIESHLSKENMQPLLNN